MRQLFSLAHARWRSHILRWFVHSIVNNLFSCTDLQICAHLCSIISCSLASHVEDPRRRDKFTRVGATLNRSLFPNAVNTHIARRVTESRSLANLQDSNESMEQLDQDRTKLSLLHSGAQSSQDADWWQDCAQLVSAAQHSRSPTLRRIQVYMRASCASYGWL